MALSNFLKLGIYYGSFEFSFTEGVGLYAGSAYMGVFTVAITLMHIVTCVYFANVRVYYEIYLNRPTMLS